MLLGGAEPHSQQAVADVSCGSYRVLESQSPDLIQEKQDHPSVEEPA